MSGLYSVMLTNRIQVGRQWRLLLTHDGMGLTFLYPSLPLHLVWS